MIRNTAFAEAFVAAAARSINSNGGNMKQCPWTARRVVERVQNSRNGTIREDDVHVRASFKTRQHIERTCEVRV